tara:strand:+ start:273 stop:731 length:459 start_codon:yes stop_codon:yes gene_type:complete
MLTLKQANNITGRNLNQSNQSPWYSDNGGDHFVNKDGLTYAGAHLIIDMWDVINLSNTEVIENTLKKIAEACDAQILHIYLHCFDENQGITGVTVLAESHINIHTWPEVRFAALDIFMCGKTNPVAAIPILESAFKPKLMEVQTVTRGIITK